MAPLTAISPPSHHHPPPSPPIVSSFTLTILSSRPSPLVPALTAISWAPLHPSLAPTCCHPPPTHRFGNEVGDSGVVSGSSSVICWLFSRWIWSKKSSGFWLWFWGCFLGVVSYLHHECIPPIVHRDVQASSILLDDKYEVRLGSLSEACAQEGDSHQSKITRFLRLPQSSEQGTSGGSSNRRVGMWAICHEEYDDHYLGGDNRKLDGGIQ